MKIVAFILAFLVLALSVMPCADGGNVLNDGKGKREITKTSNHQNDQQQDDCSPFCTCTCCAGFSINHFITAVTELPLYESNSVSAFLSSQPVGIASPIWQPPQLV